LLHHDREACGQRAARSREYDCNSHAPGNRDEPAAGHGHGDRADRHRGSHDPAHPAATARPTRRQTTPDRVSVGCPHRIGNPMSTAQEIMATVAERLAANNAAASEIGAIYKFVLEGEGGGTWIMNLKGDATLTPGDGASDCTLAMSAENGVALFEGKVTGEQLFFSNQLRVEGDMSLALRLQSLLAIVR